MTLFQESVPFVHGSLLSMVAGLCHFVKAICYQFAYTTVICNTDVAISLPT